MGEATGCLHVAVSAGICMVIGRYFAAVILLACMGGYSGTAHAIDCTAAVTEREKAVCQSDSLLAFDAMLNKAYRDELALEANPKEGDKDRNLRREQLAWIKAVDGCRADTACIRDHYAGRYVALRAYSDVRFAGMERLTGLADVLELWVSADPATGGVPQARRSDAGNTYLMAVPLSWGKPFPYYAVYFMQSGEKPERIVFPDLLVAPDMITEARSGKFSVEDMTITSGTVFQGLSFVGMDVVSEAMTGGAGSIWTYRRWHMDWTGAYGVKPSLKAYEIKNLRDGYTVKVLGTPDE